MTTDLNVSLRSITVPDNNYGRRKAKKHAQAEANRIGRRVYLQFDGTQAIVVRNHLALPNAPFWTFYPEENA